MKGITTPGSLVGPASIPVGILLLLALLLTACRSDDNADVDARREAGEKVSVRTQNANARKNGRGTASTGEVAREEPEGPVYNVESATVKQGTAQAVYTSTAVLQADREAEVSAKAGGVVEDIKAEAGDEVEKGQVLAILESVDQALRLQQARANYERTFNNWERSRKLLAKGLADAESVSNLKYETQVLKAVLDQAQLAYDNTRIKSPIDGTVVNRFIKVGSLVNNGERTFKVVDFGSLQAVVNVPEMQLRRIRTGLPARLWLDALDGTEVKASVARISPAVDEATGTFEVTLAIDEDNPELRPGLFARVAIVYDQRPNALLVDKEAVFQEDQNHYVWLIDGERVYKRAVRTGYTMGDDVEVTEGLQLGDQVVTTGKNNLSENARVRVVDYD